MMVGYLKIALFVLISGFYSASKSYSQTEKPEQHRLVVMRMIGHEVLLQSNNDTSRILPIEVLNDRYKIQFETEFSFQPQDVGGIIDGLIKKTKIATKYIVEIESCKSKKVVYSYEITDIDSLDLVPCGSRIQTKDCYTLFITLNDDAIKNSNKIKLPQEKQSYSGIIWSTLSLLVIIVLLIYLKKKGQKEAENPEILQIGSTIYYKRGMFLSFKKTKTELSSKESDLLLLLFSSENETLEREYILKEIWNDEGDYVGRTLDVFVSKLRKKLEADTSIRIINIRGIGYKLVVQQ